MIKQEIYDSVQNLEKLSSEICDTLWNNPELGGYEKESADLFRNILEKEGFKIVNEEKLEHAFYAEYGTGHPVIAVLGEYDALPELSQEISFEKKPVKEGSPGHGCGHNLLGTSTAIGAIAIKRFLEKSGISGTIRFYGCPEEELLSGKVKMIYHRMFDGCDAAVTWHPMTSNMVYDKAFLANASMRFYFKGITSHAGFAPERGRSALDAVELMNVGSNYLREHVIDKTRIHYAVDTGNFPPNIVPDRANSWYFVRAPRMGDVKNIMERIKKIAEGAALMTETQEEFVLDCGCYEFKENNAFSDLTYENLLEAEKPEYTAEEIEFAQNLQKTLNPDFLLKEKKALNIDEAMHQGVCERNLWKSYELNGSSDSGDVSQIIPSCLYTTACWPIGVLPHTWQATAANGSSLGKKGALYSAKVCAGIVFDLMTKPELLEKITKEFNDRKEKEDYEPLYSE